jgi:hypothetical protein
MLCVVNPGLIAAPFMGLFFVLLLFAIIMPLFLFKIFLWWRIFSKAGYSGAFSLLILAPFGTIIMLCILAFSSWPTEKKPGQQT